jgi:hypothetical protein
MDAYATHLEALVKAALESKGDILELGCGDYSTPILSAVAKHRGDKLCVKSSSPEWAEKFTNMASVEIVDWATWKPAGHWGMIFLDNEQLTRDRIRWLPDLQTHCDVVVMHDADASMAHSHFVEMTKGFQSIRVYATHSPWTAIFKC